jgi:ribonuclease-3
MKRNGVSKPTATNGSCPSASALAGRFKNPALFLEAVTHRSYRNENPSRVMYDNERLEFLGDTVLNFVISEALLARYPDQSEGGLSKLRAQIVSEPALAIVAKTVGLGPFLYLGIGEEKSGGREKPSLLANALEAVIAAIYLDRGMRSARGFILKQFSDLMEETSLQKPIDSKTALQERCQERSGALPTYHLISESGPGHQKQFEVEVRIGGVACGVGMGTSKKVAQQQAAAIALTQIG